MQSINELSLRAAVATQTMVNDAAEWIRDRHDDEEGQTAVEYAGILALIATIFVLLFALKLDEKIKGVVEDAVNKITNKQ
jgi:Flp pilus assembly pilin Flp